MRREIGRPSWWLLFLLPLLVVILFLGEVRAALTDAEHRMAEITILLVAFALVEWWLRANSGALIRGEGMERSYVIHSRQPASDAACVSYGLSYEPHAVGDGHATWRVTTVARIVPFSEQPERTPGADVERGGGFDTGEGSSSA